MDKGVYIIATGGGSEAVSAILTAGGASSYFIGAEVPYHPQIFENIVGEIWNGKMVSERSAHQLAAAAYDKASNCCKTPLGIGVSAALYGGTNERKGRINEVFIAIIYKTDSGIMGMTKQMMFSVKDRAYQESKVAMAVRDIVEAFKSGNTLDHTSYYSNLVNGIGVQSIRRIYDTERINTVPIMSGSYNPIHAGHIEMYHAATRFFDCEPLIEIPLSHHNKSSISPFEFQLRRDAINASMLDKPFVVAGKYPLYADKHIHYQSILPDKQIVFVMGYDVFQKISPEHKNLIKMFVFDREGNKPDLHPNAIIHNETVLHQDSSSVIRALARTEKIK